MFYELHPYHKRQDKKLTDLQETLLCATRAVANIANVVLDADNQSRMVDTKAVVTHALNVTTLMGNIDSKLNNKRKELIGKTFPTDIREVCSAQREVTTQLFCDDLGKAVREAKELNKLFNDLSPGYRPQSKPAFRKIPAQDTINGAQMANTLVTMVQVASILGVITLIKPQIESRVFISAGAPTRRGEKNRLLR